MTHASRTLRALALTLALAATLTLAGAIVTSQAQAATYTSSEKNLKKGCKGTYVGKNGDGEYGCVEKKRMILCKNGKCEVYPTRIMPTGGGSGGSGGNGAGKPTTGGNDQGSGQGTGGVNTGNANMNNGGMSSGLGGGVIN